MTEPMKRGAIAQVTTETENQLTHRLLPKGYRFEVEDYVSAEESEDGRAFYWGSADGGGNNVAVLAEFAEQVMSAEQASQRTIPTRPKLAKEIGAALVRDGGDRSGFAIFECDGVTGDGVTTELFGKTDEGLSFGFRVRVEQVWRTDD